MKDIKQYFTNGRKIVDKETAIDPGNIIEQEEQEQEQEIIATGKRKRVKIRISRSDSRSRMCNVIESKNDLIDKTPSPYNGEVNSGQKKDLRNETPKSGLIDSNIKQCFKKDLKSVEMYGNQSESEKTNILQEKFNKQIVDNSNKSVIEINESNIEFHDEIGSQQEESNAFQVLMNHSKPIQYKPQQPVEDIESKDKLDDAKELKSKRKEKLIALADKKGYTKRKMMEIEENERIEKNIESRIRFLKGDNKSNIIHKKDNNIELKNNKQLSGNLLDYFSKSSQEITNKNEKSVSTFIVKADVHRNDNSDIEPVMKPISNKIYSNKKCLKSELELSMNDIHIVAENLFSPQTVKLEQSEQKREKPRWALRIKLHSSEQNDSLNDTDDELFSSNKSKFNGMNKSRTSLNTENNKIYLKNCDRHSKKIQNKEKKEPIVNSNISYVVRDISSDNNEDTNLCLKKSNKTDKKEEKINDMNEMVITMIDDSECEIINESSLKRKPNEKLAPLFVKRRKTDPIFTTARRLFLQSDIIDMENKNINHKANNDLPILPFPAISHVTQLGDTSDSIKSEIKHKFPMKIEKKYLPSIDINNYKHITSYKEASTVTEAINKPVKKNIEQALIEIEQLYPDVQNMWKTISTIKGDSEKKALSRRGRKSKVFERKKMLTENVRNEDNQSRNCMWTYKYKPRSVQEVVGNEEAANKLKDWLSSWRLSLTKENDGSSGDEFYSSDCSSSCNNENNQIAVLLGPHGSGKSASVYAIANELGYSVLEVNASSRRTGKRILKELEEATKSHRIKKNKLEFERIISENDGTKISQNSLILLEDIDLIFEEDEGFVSAAYQLASNTKRPIVMTCRDICPHLNKMAPQQNKIYFQKISGNRISVLLRLISLAETGYKLSHNCLMKLLQAGDLRQALLQLQYLLLSGSPVLSEQSTIIKLSLWQDMQRYLYKPAIKLNKKHKTKKNINIKNSNVICILNKLAEDLDNLALMSSLIDIEDITLNMSEENTQPSLSLAENISFYSALREIKADIANFISDRILYKDFKANEQVQNQSNIILRKQLNQGVDLTLSHVTSTCLDRQIMAIDYLPIMRAICRAEESRSTINSKRSNRFFHYLHNLKVPTALMKPNILSAACRMLQEENKNAS
ncbi:hypothetical protein P5V15_007045 [Pogonomyrmex californicus]